MCNYAILKTSLFFNYFYKFLINLNILNIKKIACSHPFFWCLFWYFSSQFWSCQGCLNPMPMFLVNPPLVHMLISPRFDQQSGPIPTLCRSIIWASTKSKYFSFKWKKPNHINSLDVLSSEWNASINLHAIHSHSHMIYYLFMAKCCLWFFIIFITWIWSLATRTLMIAFWINNCLVNLP